MTERSGRIEAVISDFGGVLTTPLIQSFMAFQDQTGISTEVLGKAMQAATEANGDNPLFEMERGEITEVAFLEQLTDSLEPLLGHRPEMHRFKEIYFEALKPNPPMIELMRELKGAGYRMAMLTNNVREWEPLVAPDAAGRRDLRDRRRLRLRRLPQARIEDLRDHAGADRACRPRPASSSTTSWSTAKAPEKAGMTAVHFQDNEQAIPEIRAALAAAS